MKIHNYLKVISIPVTAIAFFFAIYVPMVAYVNNSQEFLQVRPWLLFGASLCVFSMLWILLVILFLLLKNASLLSRYTLAVLCGLTLAFYVQGNLINLNYGVLDGREIPWDKMVGAGIINTIVWVIILAGFISFAFLAKKNFFGLLKTVMFCFLAYTVLVLGMRYITFVAPNEYPVPLTEKDMMVVSKNTNVVVVVLDSFDQALMDETLVRYPELKERLEGLTYYKNTVGFFSYTYLALPQIVTGIATENAVHEGTKEYRNYINSAYDKSIIMATLQHNKFVADLYVSSLVSPNKKIIEKCPFINNVGHIGIRFDWIYEYCSCLNSSSFIYLPHFLKRFHKNVMVPIDKVEKENDEKKWDCIASERKIAKCLKFGKFETVSENRFKFYYFYGTHLPDYNVEKAKESINNVSELMRKISSVSSNSCFIILADHGVKDRSKPIFMCSNGTSEFKTSSIPFSYLNISNVIVQALGGQDIIPPASLKLRQYVFADKNNFRTNLYDSSGDISLPVEYKKVYTGRDRMISGGLEWDMSGKSSTVWTIGHDAYLHLPIMPKLRGKDFYVQIEAMALLGGFRKKQEVEFYLGDSVKKRIIYDSKSRIQNTKLFVTAQESRGQSSLQIRFRIKHPTAPRLIIPNSHDPRPLGILLHRIELIELDSEKTILCENLGIEQNKICFISGFANPEPPYGCWNNGFKSVIKTILPENLKGENIEVTFSCHAFLAGGKIPKQRMKVSSAGKVLIEKSFSKEGVESFKVRLPVEVTKKGQVTLDFEFPDCASPKELGMSEDPRKLAVFFRTCEIKAVKNYK